jgi:hypothetical protein
VERQVEARPAVEVERRDVLTLERAPFEARDRGEEALDRPARGAAGDGLRLDFLQARARVVEEP